MGYYFSGSHEHQLDAKRRFRIPAKMKGMLGEGYGIGVGPDHCLWIMPAETSHRIQDNLLQVDMGDEKARAVKRRLSQGMIFPEEDGQGRIVLPTKLAAYAGIEKDILFIGQGNYIELWSAERYEEYISQFEDIDLGQYIKF